MMPKVSNKKGFILVLVVSLSAIIALLAAALISLTRVESTSIEFKTHVSIARDNARAALDMALGDLQMFAGRDQTSTALADGFRSPEDDNFVDDAAPVDGGGARIYQPFWTGVWDNDPITTDDPVWLVTRPIRTGSDFDTGSGTTASPFVDPANGAGIDYVVLVDQETAEFAGTTGTQADFNIAVPLETVEAASVIGHANNTAVGKYGYWVGDLGVKSSYSIPYRLDSIDHDNYRNTLESSHGTRSRLLQMLGQSHAYSSINPTVNPNFSLFPSLINDFQMRVAKPDVSPPTNLIDGLSMEGTRRNFHNSTLLARGLLINSLDGGLKVDLSPLEVTGDADPVVDDQILSHANLANLSLVPPDPLRRVYSTVAKVFNSGSGSYSGFPRIGPVVTEFNISFVVYLDRDGSQLYGRIAYNGDIEIWNPYTSSLADPNGGSFTVEITDLPTVEGKYEAAGNPVGTGVTDLDARVSNSAFLLSMADPLRPGQVRLYSGGSATLIDFDSTGSTVIDVTSDIGFTDPTPSTQDDVFMVRVMDACQPSVVLRNSNGDEIARYSIDFPYSAFPAGYYVNVPIDPPTPYSGYFGYTWEREDPIFGSKDWSDFDPRIESVASAETYAFDPDPLAAVNYSHTVQDSTIRILGYTNPADVAYDVPLFELPRQELVSIAELQHADLGTGFPRQIGRSNGALGSETNYNRLFDQYFFSTVPQSVSSSWSVGDPFPNARIRHRAGAILSDLQGLDSAQHLFVEGAFNVNSTSIAAWTAVLKGIRLGEWDFYDWTTGSAATQGFGTDSQFAYYSQTAEEVWDANVLLDTRESYRRGVRSFTHGNLVDLATEIVEQIRTKIDSSGPFENLKEFVDAGVLDTAIANAGLNSPPISSANIVPNSPQWLSQGTLLNSLAPFLTTRSDTFLIRAYGDSRNPSDEDKIVARAYCEAVVQRLPDKHPSDDDASDPMTPTSEGAGEFGRQFEVIAFRWLTGEEI